MSNIIKDKLNDGQLDICDLTLKELDLIARSFIHIFSGYFHEREEYPEVKLRKETDKAEWDPAVLRLRSAGKGRESQPDNEAQPGLTDSDTPVAAPMDDDAVMTGREAGKFGEKQT